MVSGYFQKDENLHITNDFKEEGFVFAPFNNAKDAILIPKEEAEFYTEVLHSTPMAFGERYFDEDKRVKGDHLQLIQKGINGIKEGLFKKVVLTRKEELQVDSFNLIDTFKRLLQTYNNAFVFLWYHPKVGLWMGATPETLISISKDTFETMSLAGTQEYKGSVQVKWKDKELYEQQLVTDYVLEKLKPICSSVTAAAVQTIRAGNLLHLKTEIKGVFKRNARELISVLHPTPAVCGYPKEASKDFILKNENYNRAFYTGFLGELNAPHSELYVNLRCMQYDIDKKVTVYVGGGITAESNPEKEWKETVAKTKTIKKVL